MKDEIKGKAEEIKGKVTGDRSEELKGKMRQTADKTKRVARDISGDVHEGADRMHERVREDEVVREDPSR